VLRKTGQAMFVEPWLTPFLRLVHWLAARELARGCSTKLDALQTMAEHERRTYQQWLSQPDLILKTVRTCFCPIHESFTWGKWTFAGKPR
jgi:hypothetical protein